MLKLGAKAVLLTMVLVLGLLDSAEAQPPGGEAPIRLQAGTFLPSQGEPYLVAGLRLPGFAPNVRGTFIVQFTGPVEDAWKDAVAAAGGELLEYIPDFAFKVRMTPAQARAVRALAPVHWVGVFHPAYKLSPRLTRGGERLYTVRLEHGSDPAGAAAALTAAGARVQSQDGRTLVVVADETRLDALAQVLDVAWIEDFQLRKKHNEHAGQIMGAPTAWGSGYDGSTQTVAIADTGLGNGTATGAHQDIPAGRITNIFNWPGATDSCFQTIVNDGARDVDTGHGTHVTGSVLGGGDAQGRGKGTAPGAHLVFQAVENYATISALCQFLYGLTDGYYLVGIPADLRTLFQQAYTAGARVHSNSWGSDASGAYTTDCANTDDFVWNHRDSTVTFSAGNAGVDANGDGAVDTGSLGSPASAKNVIAVGASENDRASDYACDTSISAVCANQGGQNHIPTYFEWWPSNYPAVPLKTDPIAGNAEQMAAFSSRGPADDGRIKPDVVAPGTWILSTYSDLYQPGYDPAPNPQDGQFQYPGWGYPLNARYKYLGGTSMANPLVAGGAAVVRDYYQKAHGHAASAALVKATIINSAVDLLDEDNNGVNNNTLPIPNMSEGWGRVNLAAAVDGSRAYRDEGPTLSTNGLLTYTYSVAAGTPLKVSLVWTDRAASLSSVRRLVNDLDLEVLGPGGVHYQGNAFAISYHGWTVPNSGVPDRANNVENVYVESPAAGNWAITVRGYNVPMGPQNFALVVAGQSVQPVYALMVTAPSHGTITSPDGFINCGTAAGACSHGYVDGTNVSLSALPDPGYILSAWSGDCSGTGSCSVTMSQDRAVGATFGLAPTPSLSINDVAVTEGNCGQTNAVFTVSLSAPSALTVTVNYATADGTATTAGQDYVDTSGTLVFAPTVTTQTITVAVKGDTAFEPDETFAVTLSTPANATLARATGTGTITNDDRQLLVGEEVVVWTDIVGVSPCGPDLTKTAPVGWGNAGAASTRAIASGASNGYAEFTATADYTGDPFTGQAMFGLSNGDDNQLYSDIDYAFYTYAGYVLIFEKGVSVGNWTPYTPGEKLRVGIDAGVVKYWKNGVLLYTSSQQPVFPLRVDTSVFSPNASIQGVVLAGTLIDLEPNTTEPVVWTDAVGVALNGNNLTKTAPVGWGNAGAASTRAIASGAANGYAEFTATADYTGDPSTGQAMFGLSNGDDNQLYSDIDYAFYTYAGYVLIFEKGANVGNWTPYTPGDKLRVGIDAGTVKYWKNGVLLYTSNKQPIFPLRVDTSVFSPNASIQGALLAGAIGEP